MTNFFLSICCGAGGASFGAVASGYHTLGIEIDPKIAELYRTNVGEVLVEDITKIDPFKIELPGSDRNGLFIVQVSPPCQFYSQANTRNKSDEGSELLRETFHHYKVWRPDIVILENVRAYQHSKVYKDFHRWMKYLGYKCLPLFLNAADFGVAQSRQRFIAIFTKGDIPKIKTTHEETPGQLNLFEGSKQRWVGWGEAIFDIVHELKPSKLSPRQIESIHKYGMRSQLVDGQNGNSVKLGYKVRTFDEPSFTLGCNAKAKAKALLVERLGGYDDRKKVRESIQPIWTIKASIGTDEKGSDRRQFIDVVLSKSDVRSLNVKALARLQSFPDSYQWSGKNSVDIRGIGNSVPPLMMQRILESLS